MAEKVASLYAEISADTSKLEKGLKETKSGLQAAKFSFTELASVVSLAGQAFDAAGQLFEATAGKAIKYNKAMLEGSQVTGMQVEAFSRLVQVGDDVEISSETITTALAMMRQKGLQPSIEAIADLADEYVASGNTSEFAEKAVERLGRGWKELAPLLSMGGDALKDATAAIDDNLVATEAEIRRTEELRLAIDSAKDAWEGYTLVVGGKVAPILTDILTPAHAEIINGQKFMVETTNGVTRAYLDQGGKIREVTNHYNNLKAATVEYTWAKKDELAIVTEVTAETEDMNYVVMNADYFASRASSAFIEFGKGLKEVEEKAAEATPEVKGFLDGIDRNIASPISNFIKDIQWMLAGGGEITKAFETLQELAPQMDPAEVQRLAGELLVATTDLEVTLDPTKLQDAAANLKDTLGAEAARIAMQDIKGTEGIEGALKAVTDVQYYLDFHFRYHGTPPSAYTGGGSVEHQGNVVIGGPHAAGGDVFPGMAYPVGERGVELFAPNQPGRIIPNDQLSGGTNISIAIYPTPGMDEATVGNIVAQKLSIAFRNMRAGGYARGA